ncbi:TetR family transcriptional regulator C-terminal domain-containing protein [Roseivirga sp.]|uniref:TetR/AcrR family transcriptional regulator n=1 Tax=Roseivirga sp. TaxID=1964215 RepID=UPI003B51B4B2
MKEGTIEHILQIGTDLIIRNGFHNIGLKKILDEAGIPKGSFYYYFNSKDDFGQKVINYYSKGVEEFLRGKLESQKIEPKQRIIDLLESMKAVYKDEDFARGCLLGNSSLELSAQNTSFATLIDESFNRWQKLFSTAIEEGQKSGNIKRSMSPDQYASFILNSWEGALVRMKSTKNNEPLDLLIDVLKNML